MPDDLVLLVADKNMEYGVRGLLRRLHSLGIRSIEARVYVHQRRDPGCLLDAHNFLRPFIGEYRHAMVMFDRTGSGREELSAEELGEQVRSRLASNGWGNRAEVIVLDPELEVWVFTSSREVEQCLGWQRATRLRRWLENRSLWAKGEPKPGMPKEALERTLYELRRPRSSSIYQCLAERVTVDECVDPAFRKFKDTLAGWFPVQESS